VPSAPLFSLLLQLRKLPWPPQVYSDADSFSGTTIAALAAENRGRLEARNATIEDVEKGILRLEIPDGIDASWKDMIRRCWDSNPARRPTFKEIVARMLTADFIGSQIDVARLREYQKTVVTPDLYCRPPSGPVPIDAALLPFVVKLTSYEMGSVIGQGAYGEAFYARDPVTGAAVVVKKSFRMKKERDRQMRRLSSRSCTRNVRTNWISGCSSEKLRFPPGGDFVRYCTSDRRRLMTRARRSSSSVLFLGCSLLI
jgi:hypothetical protein